MLGQTWLCARGIKLFLMGRFSKTLLPAIFYKKGTGGLATIKGVYLHP